MKSKQEQVIDRFFSWGWHVKEWKMPSYYWCSEDTQPTCILEQDDQRIAVSPDGTIY